MGCARSDAHPRPPLPSRGEGEAERRQGSGSALPVLTGRAYTRESGRVDGVRARVRRGRCRVPLYDYQCDAGHRYEKREPFGSPPQQPCEQCGKVARRLLNAPPIVFKGSGWYKTDSTRSLRGGVDALPDSAADSADSASDGAGAVVAPAGADAAKTAAKKPAAAKAKGKGKGRAEAKPAPAPAASADD